ncbi:MAG TPA: tannase/feruloyl esterase family alpha/beta hydrolase [Bryobacteraceae bacterium]|nr:tannase/feruloyl esterase family alpha/beta hydrolase [Bryobacteraceae bacterium]
MTCRSVRTFRLLITVLTGLPAAAFAANCDALRALSLPDTTITAATTVAAGGFAASGNGGRGGEAFRGLPAFCEVHGVIKPTPASAIHFEVWLPLTGWNGKLEAVGNGGLAGSISFAAMAVAVQNGYAAASTDTGHTTAEPKEWLQNRERLIDYSYRSLHLTTVDAKAVVNAFYGQTAAGSYYTGCSTGGKQGLMEAQRYPADFDGIVAGDAANFWTHQMMSEVWDGIATSTPETVLSTEKLQLVQDAVLKQCDGLDGVVDGLIADPRRCHFNPKALLCKGGDASNCLTAAQESAVRKIYAGPSNPRTGASLYPGMYPGGELGWGKAGGQMVINRGSTSGVSSYDFMRLALFANPTWEFRSFDFDRDAQALDEKLASVTNATSPDLEEFRKLGHKLIYYHGTSDPLIPAQNGIDYYESVIAAEGKGATGLGRTQEFFRVFLVPGLYHCAGGPGAIGFGGNIPASQRDADHDALSAAVRWVEKGTPPDRIIATKYVDGAPAKGVALQRPLCAYPLAGRYKGSGDTNDAGNFSCVK